MLKKILLGLATISLALSFVACTSTNADEVNTQYHEGWPAQVSTEQ